MEKTFLTYVNNPDMIKGIRVENDINKAVEAVLNGETVARFEFGDSMTPILRNGEYGIITPVSIDDIKVGDAVLCKVGPYLMTHMVCLISDSSANGRYALIGSTRFELYGWIKELIFAKKNMILNENEWTKVFLRFLKERGYYWDYKKQKNIQFSYFGYSFLRDYSSKNNIPLFIAEIQEDIAKYDSSKSLMRNMSNIIDHSLTWSLCYSHGSPYSYSLINGDFKSFCERINRLRN